MNRLAVLPQLLLSLPLQLEWMSRLSSQFDWMHCHLSKHEAPQQGHLRALRLLLQLLMLLLLSPMAPLEQVWNWSLVQSWPEVLPAWDELRFWFCHNLQPWRFPICM